MKKMIKKEVAFKKSI